jgi:ABC-type branched-subunit amino acid transport system ATPase component
MNPGDFAVPGALLRTAGDGLTGEVADLDQPPSAPVPGRTRWYDGAAAALVVLGVLGGGVVPAIGITVAALGLIAIVVANLFAPVLARAEDRRLLAAMGLPEDTPLAPRPRTRLTATTGRVGRRRGVRDFAALSAVLGCAAVAVPLFAGRVLMRDESATQWTRLAVLASAAFAGLLLGPLVAAAMSWLAVRQVDPERVVAASSVATFSLAVGLSGLLPSLTGTAVLLAIGECFVFAACRGTARCINVAVAAAERPAAWLSLYVFAVVVGGGVGATILDLVAARESPRWAVVILAPVGLAVAAGVLTAANRGTTKREAAEVVAAVRERQFAQQRADEGIPPPAVEVAGLDFSYGTQPVLRGVSLAVEQGEVAALLGTNGAGKSTLLRVIAGLAAPERGMVRLFGEPAALSTTERLGDRGIALVLGGGMTFPGLTVEETVRLTSIGLDNPADVEEIYGRFPVLWRRRTQRTGTLSGGEQQMLALGRALLTRPKLLMIDELSLGLAPKIVGQLVELVDEINAQGATVILVEQSVNVATNIAWHAFFLERGEIRYDGPTHELLERDDLLRSVFLAGAEL